MYLASVDDLRTQLGFDDMTDINIAIGDALDGAENMLASILRTEFNLVNVVDQFYVDESARLNDRAVRTQLLLTRGFLQLSPCPAATLINSVAPIFTNAYDEVQAQYSGNGGPTPNFLISSESGLAIDTTNFYSDTYVSVAYTAGFMVSYDDASSYVLNGPGAVPNWLQQAAKLMALVLLADSAPITEAGITIDKKMNQGQATLLLAKRVRYFPLALDPFIPAVFS